MKINTQRYLEEIMDAIRIANQAAFIRLLEHNVQQSDKPFERLQIEDVHIIARKIWNRTGVPDDAVTVDYHLSHDEWQLYARAVWRHGKLYQPVAVHSPIVGYAPPDMDGALTTDEVAALVNEWFCGCSAI